MNQPAIDPVLTVFTKPWKTLTLEALADQVASWGLHGIELPVRPGFQVEPQDALETLPEAQRVFKDRGLKIVSVAGDLDEAAVRACAAAEVPILRVMLRIDLARGYRVSVAKFQETADSLTPLLRETGVVIGLQNHAGDFVGSAVGLMDVLAPLNPACVRAVLDLGHTALAGEPEPIAIDVASPRLAMVNLKNAIHRVVNEDEDGVKTWKTHWTTARGGLTSWATAVSTLRKHFYQGPLCLTAEYHDPDGKFLSGDPVLPLIQDDIAFLKSLLSAG
ncbi:MAG: sugar phosphate isomerase/epimerase [Verrucomicrobia bacterium]|nr:MAG: sugar phosphate isomerase/epimerase [Verrucomicrobiota bacterium]